MKPYNTKEKSWQLEINTIIPVDAAASVVNPIVTFDFGAQGQPITLRGVAQQLAVNLNGVTITGGTFDIVIEWYEL